MPDDLDAEIEKTRKEIEGHRERLRELEEKRAEREAEGVDLGRFQEMSASERRQLKETDPERWRELMEQKRQRAEKRLESTPGGSTF